MIRRTFCIFKVVRRCKTNSSSCKDQNEKPDGGDAILDNPCISGIGGTVRKEGIFSDREMAFENEYFYRENCERIKELREKIRKRRKELDEKIKEKLREEN